MTTYGGIWTSILIVWMSPLPFLGALGVIFISFFDEIPVGKQYSPRWSHKNDARLIWVKKLDFKEIQSTKTGFKKSIDRERYPCIDNVHMKCGLRLQFKVFQPYSNLAFEIIRLLSELRLPQRHQAVHPWSEKSIYNM